MFCQLRPTLEMSERCTALVRTEIDKTWVRLRRKNNANILISGKMCYLVYKKPISCSLPKTFSENANNENIQKCTTSRQII